MISGETVVHALESFVYRRTLPAYGDRTARAAAAALFDCVCLNFRAQSMYVPTSYVRHAREVHEAIWREFNYRNHAELALKYNLSVQWVYKVVKQKTAEGVRRRQDDLFQEDLEAEQDRRPETMIVLEDLLPAEFQRAGLPEPAAAELAAATAEKLLADYPGQQFGGFDGLYKKRHSAANGDVFDWIESGAI